MMAFSKSCIPFPPTKLEPGSCHAARIEAMLEKPIPLLTLTREECELKQLAYERDRRKYRKEHPERTTST
jgi:hypothetical protein